MKQKISVKMSEENIKFWRNINRNCIKTDKINDMKSLSYLQTMIVNYFKNNNDRYLELLEYIGKMEENNGTK